MGFPPFTGKWFGMHGHYIYGNQNAVELYGRRAPFLCAKPGGTARRHPETARRVPLGAGAAGRLDARLGLLSHFHRQIHGRAARPTRAWREVWGFVLAVNEHGAGYFLPNIAISITQSTLYRLLHRLLHIGFGSDEADSLFDRLLAYCETRTGMINKELFELAAMVRARPELEKIVHERTSRDILGQKMLDRFPEFQSRLEKFLRDHGHREVDFDAYSPTWLESPWVVLDNVRLILQTPMDQDPAAKERDLKIRMQQAELELFQKLPPDLHFFFAEILRLARVYTSLDDLEHYQTTRLTLPLRRGLRELGGRLAERGILAEAMDIFFARCAQIDQATAQDDGAGWSEFAQAVRRQKEDYLRDKARKPEWILGENKPAEPASGDCLSGLAGSSGQAEGPVFLVLGPDDFAKFPKGAVWWRGPPIRPGRRFSTARSRW